MWLDRLSEVSRKERALGRPWPHCSGRRGRRARRGIDGSRTLSGTTKPPEAQNILITYRGFFAQIRDTRTADENIASYDQNVGLAYPCPWPGASPSDSLIASAAARGPSGLRMKVLAPCSSCGSEPADIRMTGSAGYSC
jgi:hypothetical protein